MAAHKVVSREKWIAARRKLLAKEKQLTRLADRLAKERRALPWEAVTKEYGFDGPAGRETLAQLFDGRGQLVVYHFMFGPDWDAGCPHCSRWADNFNGIIVHLNQRDVTMVAVSRAPYEKLAAYRQRMGWSFKWVSSFGSDFNFDFNVSFTPEEMKRKKALYNFKLQNPDASEREGVSVFVRDAGGKVHRAYSTFARGIEALNLDYKYLDVVPKGRDESGRGPFWVRRHDEYGR
ncbi:MAG TPA: thioredoxin family protein [Candidatus Bathyarchaeia archaeon]|nr:thioredoxin family protein [Candidatus Bathyarchaeia archaeon]